MSHAAASGAPLDLLAIVAHPDDAELLCGGTLIKCADTGGRAGILDLTRGESGSKGTPELRAREAAAADEVMRLTVRANVGLPDSAIRNDTASRVAVAAHIRAFRPDTVLTHWPTGRHPDHRRASELAYDAAFLSGLVNFPADGAPFRPTKFVFCASFREDSGAPSFVVDITDQIDRKLEAIACYRSQFDGARTAGEVYAGGDRPLLDQIRAQAAHYGSLIRKGYGEPFRTRETLELELPNRDRVGSF